MFPDCRRSIKGSVGTILLDYISQNHVEVIKASTFYYTSIFAKDKYGMNNDYWARPTGCSLFAGVPSDLQDDGNEYKHL